MVSKVGLVNAMLVDPIVDEVGVGEVVSPEEVVEVDKLSEAALTMMLSEAEADDDALCKS